MGTTIITLVIFTCNFEKALYNKRFKIKEEIGDKKGMNLLTTLEYFNNNEKALF